MARSFLHRILLYYSRLFAIARAFVVVPVVAALWALATTAAFAEGRWQPAENKVDCAVWNAFPFIFEKVTWSGACANGMAQGHGIQAWRRQEDGKWQVDKYTGEMKDGKQHGRGFYELSNGNKYEGDWKEGEMHGRGVFVFSNGNRYEGDYLNSRWHGRGVFSFSNGNRYDGDYLNDRWHGRGVFSFANGDEVRGEWKDGNLVGLGRCLTGSGARFDCHFDGNQYTRSGPIERPTPQND